MRTPRSPGRWRELRHPSADPTGDYRRRRLRDV